MKKILLKNIGVPFEKSDLVKLNLYNVFLWHDKTIHFSNFKDAENFIAETNRFLNTILFEVNDIYTRIFIEYRRAWFYAGNNRALKKNIEMIEHAFDKIITSSEGPNKNFYVYNGLIKIAEYCMETLNDIETVCKQAKIYRDAQAAISLKKQITRIKDDLIRYPEKSS